METRCEDVLVFPLGSDSWRAAEFRSNYLEHFHLNKKLSVSDLQPTDGLKAEFGKSSRKKETLKVSPSKYGWKWSCYSGKVQIYHQHEEYKHASLIQMEGK